jgi:hypothetical protein
MSTTASALINNAIDLGLDICEAPIGDGFLIVTGPADAVTEWANEAAMVYPNGDGRLIAAREVRAA